MISRAATRMIRIHAHHNDDHGHVDSAHTRGDPVLQYGEYDRQYDVGYTTHVNGDQVNTHDESAHERRARLYLRLV